MADIGGDRGDWSAVRSRKRKATEPEQRGQDWTRQPDWHGGAVQGYDKMLQTGSDRVSNGRLGFQKDNQVQFDSRVSSDFGS